MKFLLAISVIFMSAQMTEAKIRVPAKATTSCQTCIYLKLKADEIEKKLQANENDADKIISAITETKEAFKDFLETSGELDDKKISAIIRAWSVVSVHDVYVSVPTDPDIKSKISDDDFRKIQTTASNLARRYCQPVTTKEGEEPTPSCSEEDRQLKTSYQAISMSIMQAFAERDNP